MIYTNPYISKNNFPKPVLSKNECSGGSIVDPIIKGLNPDLLFFPVPFPIIHNNDEPGKQKHANKENRYGHFFLLGNDQIFIRSGYASTPCSAKTTPYRCNIILNPAFIINLIWFSGNLLTSGMECRIYPFQRGFARCNSNGAQKYARSVEYRTRALILGDVPFPACCAICSAH